LYSGASLDADKLRNDMKAARAVIGVAHQEATQVRDEKAAAEAEVHLLVDATTACDTAFPVPYIGVPPSLARLPSGHGVRSYSSRGCHGSGRYPTLVWRSGESPGGAAGISAGTG
jgi:hypothetical protein